MSCQHFSNKGTETQKRKPPPLHSHNPEEHICREITHSHPPMPLPTRAAYLWQHGLCASNHCNRGEAAGRHFYNHPFLSASFLSTVGAAALVVVPTCKTENTHWPFIAASLFGYWNSFLVFPFCNAIQHLCTNSHHWKGGVAEHFHWLLCTSTKKVMCSYQFPGFTSHFLIIPFNATALSGPLREKAGVQRL